MIIVRIRDPRSHAGLEAALPAACQPADMLQSIRRFFEERVAVEAAQPAPEVREHGLRLAAAALLFEIVRADAEIKEEERTVVRAAIQGTFGLERGESEELMRLAEEESKGATSLIPMERMAHSTTSRSGMPALLPCLRR